MLAFFERHNNSILGSVAFKMASPVKGDRIYFTGGVYKGLTGWMDVAKTATKLMYYVLVLEDNGDEKPARMKKNSVSMAETVEREPDSYEEACLQQHPDIENMMDKLAEKLSMCNVGPNEIGSIFLKKMKEATLKQAQMGSKALWHQIEYKHEGY